MTYGKCELLTCIYNKNHECNDKLNRERCVGLCSAVLGEQFMKFFENERMEGDDLK